MRCPIRSPRETPPRTPSSSSAAVRTRAEERSTASAELGWASPWAFHPLRRMAAVMAWLSDGAWMNPSVSLSAPRSRFSTQPYPPRWQPSAVEARMVSEGGRGDRRVPRVEPVRDGPEALAQQDRELLGIAGGEVVERDRQRPEPARRTGSGPVHRLGGRAGPAAARPRRHR